MSLVELIQQDPQTYKLGSANQLQFKHNGSEPQQKLKLIGDLLDKFRLGKKQAA